MYKPSFVSLLYIIFFLYNLSFLNIFYNILQNIL